MQKKPVRLQKYIAQCGLASRRKAEELIAAGLVKVNGQTAKIGDACIPGVHHITVAGKMVKEKHIPERIYLMLNKPRGYVTTLHDEQGRKCVAELVKDCGVRVFPVGRLDRESEGLLLLTNDGDFTQRMTHPSYHVSKTYFLSVRPQMTVLQQKKLEEGVMVDGSVTQPAKVKLLSNEEGKSLIEITIYEGRNRQIRKMCEAVGLEVARLKRISVGSQNLGGLRSGKWRALTKREVQALLKEASFEPESGSAISVKEQERNL